MEDRVQLVDLHQAQQVEDRAVGADQVRLQLRGRNTVADIDAHAEAHARDLVDRGKVEDEIEKASVAKTLQAIDTAHVVVFVVDAHEGIGEQDANVLGLALQRGRALIIAVNKWDGIPMEQREDIRRLLALKLDFVPYAPQHFISARHGTGVGELVAATIKAYDAAMTEIPTPKLTKTLERAMVQHQPPLVRGRRIKLRYAHQGGRNQIGRAHV
mgnify:CR=1 FL=1